MEQPEAARERSRAWLVSSPLNGHGVAPFGNNRRPCLEQPEAAGERTRHWPTGRAHDGRQSADRLAVCRLG
ncbi:MAG: hypothetical protein LBD24_02210, partial [Spirochaetaceae bacterium]|nr:hypothetical protein [Spirochaetaceae bacterium]